MLWFHVKIHKIMVEWNFNWFMKKRKFQCYWWKFVDLNELKQIRLRRYFEENTCYEFTWYLWSNNRSFCIIFDVASVKLMLDDNLLRIFMQPNHALQQWLRWIVCMCLFKFNFRVNVLRHRMQRCGFSPEWMCMWAFKLWLNEWKNFLHK